MANINSYRSGGFRMEFDNGLELSVQWAPGNYADNRYEDYREEPVDGWTSKTVEIAIFKDGKFYMPESIFPSEPVDEVIGWVPVEDLPGIIQQVKDLPPAHDEK